MKLTISVASSSQAPGPTYRRIGALVLKGKALGVPAVTIAADDALSAPLDEYERAYDLMRDQDPKVLAVFSQLLDTHSDDPLVALHLNRLSAREVGETIVFSEK